THGYSSRGTRGGTAARRGVAAVPINETTTPLSGSRKIPDLVAVAARTAKHSPAMRRNRSYRLGTLHDQDRRHRTRTPELTVIPPSWTKPHPSGRPSPSSPPPTRRRKRKARSTRSASPQSRNVSQTSSPRPYASV